MESSGHPNRRILPLRVTDRQLLACNSTNPANTPRPQCISACSHRLTAGKTRNVILNPRSRETRVRTRSTSNSDSTVHISANCVPSRVAQSRRVPRISTNRDDLAQCAIEVHTAPGNSKSSSEKLTDGRHPGVHSSILWHGLRTLIFTILGVKTKSVGHLRICPRSIPADAPRSQAPQTCLPAISAKNFRKVFDTCHPRVIAKPPLK